MKKSGLADSPFFTAPAKNAPAPSPSETKTAKKETKKKQGKRIGKKEAERRSNNHDGMQSSNHATMPSIIQAGNHDAIVELIRRSVKVVGKEPSTHRMTPEEKRELVDVVYAYKRRGVPTSENEIARIAINLLVADYKENGENSVLHKVLQALNE